MIDEVLKPHINLPQTIYEWVLANSHTFSHMYCIGYVHTHIILVLYSLRSFPAHMHIDILQRAQGVGNGRRLISTLLAKLKEERVPGVHLEMHKDNKRAYDFYMHMGFHQVGEERDCILLAMTLTGTTGEG